MNQDYSALTLSELRQLGKERGLKKLSALKKNELIELLSGSTEKTTSLDTSSTLTPNQVNKNYSSTKDTSTPVRENPSIRQGNTNNEQIPVNTTENGLVKERNNYSSNDSSVSDSTRSNTPKSTNHSNTYGNRTQNSSQRYSCAPQRTINGKPQTTGQRPSYTNTNPRPANQAPKQTQPSTIREPYQYTDDIPSEISELDSGVTKTGILEVMPEGFGFIRCENFLPGADDVYVSPMQIRRFALKTGDIISGNTRIRNQNEKFSALLYINSVNGILPSEAAKRTRFENLTPIFPNERIHLETPGCGIGMRMMDILSPIGKGQRGMIVSQPKTGKTTLLKQIARAITKNHPDIKLIILLIDERPEEVTDIKESIEGENVEVIYSTFDELPEKHKRVSEMVIEYGRRLVESKRDVVILLDSITRLARAYNLTVPASGRTLSGGLDPTALHMPKKFFGAARNMREGGSLTILATALVETGSRMDDVVFEEFKGTGNMELVLNRNLSEKRIFPAINLPKSSTRRDDLLLTEEEMQVNEQIRRAFNANAKHPDEAVEKVIGIFERTKNNREFIEYMKKIRL